jgi:hypothetical protein
LKVGDGGKMVVASYMDYIKTKYQKKFEKDIEVLEE